MARQPVMDRLPHEKSDIWKKELKALMSDFCIPVNIIEQIIRTAERKAKLEESCKSVHQRGWIMFKEFLLQKQ